MNLKQLQRTIFTDLRRAVRQLPATAIYTLIFLLVSLIVIKNGEKLFFNPNQTAQVPVGLHMQMDDADDEAGFALVEEMQSFRETLQINRFATEDEGLKALADGEITALILIPDDFVNGIYANENKPIRIVFKENNTMEEHIVNDLLLNSAQLLGTAQAVEFTLRQVNEELSVDPDETDAFVKQINANDLTYVLTREGLFDPENYDNLSHLPLSKQLAACYTLLVLSLLSFLLTPFYQGRKTAYVIRQRAAGLNRFGIRISELISTVFLLYFAYVIIFTSLMIAGFGAKWTSLLWMIPISAVIGLFIHVLAYTVKSSAYANLVILIGIVLLMYISGGLVPMELLPRFLQKLSSFNPVYGLIRLLQGIMY